MAIFRNALFSSVVICSLLPILTLAQVEATSSPALEPGTTATTAAESWFTVERLFGEVDSGDFVVGPGRSELLNLEPGGTRTVFITLANRISDNRTFELTVADVTGSADGSSALQVIEGERGPFSVLDFISFPEDRITLDLGERARIPVTVTIPPDAEPGGYYGTVLVSTIQPGSAVGDLQPRNPIIARVGSHVFFTVGGEQEMSGAVLDISTIPDRTWYTAGPINFGIAFENTGSIHLNPYGQLSIINILGDEVGYMELEPWFVLPQSLRTREIEWNRELLFGRYTAVATINRGYDDILDEVSVVFWVVPYQLIIGLFVGLFTVFFLIRLFFRTFEFKKK